VIPCAQPQRFAVAGMGGAEQVYTINHGELAVVVSDSCADHYPVSRENTLTHQRVLEFLLPRFTLLPVRFGTQAATAQQVRQAVLVPRYREFQTWLSYLRGKQQYGLKVFWRDMAQVYRELAEGHPEIKRWQYMAQKGRPMGRQQLIEAGRLVEQALLERKKALRQQIMAALDKYAWKSKTAPDYGERMFLNANFLVEETSQEQFDRQLALLREQLGDGVHFKYVGPLPPYDFVQIQIDLPGEK
ncbi:MAG: GvpL/GvpF family gas vesicle protein, partial [Bacillota bacterium]